MAYVCLLVSRILFDDIPSFNWLKKKKECFEYLSVYWCFVHVCVAFSVVYSSDSNIEFRERIQWKQIIFFRLSNLFQFSCSCFDTSIQQRYCVTNTNKSSVTDGIISSVNRFLLMNRNIFKFTENFLFPLFGSFSIANKLKVKFLFVLMKIFTWQLRTTIDLTNCLWSFRENSIKVLVISYS